MEGCCRDKKSCPSKTYLQLVVILPFSFLTRPEGGKFYIRPSIIQIMSSSGHCAFEFGRWA